MDNPPSELLNAVLEIRELLRLMAEPAIAERDRNLRSELRRIVGKSPTKAKSVLLMDGNHTQTTIYNETGFDRGDLSRLVKTLIESKLISGDGKQPKLVISIPATFFEEGGPNG
jgi:hypothetical protein